MLGISAKKGDGEGGVIGVSFDADVIEKLNASVFGCVSRPLRENESGRE